MKWLVLAVVWPAAAFANDPQAVLLIDCGTPTTLRAAIGDLRADFGTRYPSGDEFLRRLVEVLRAGHEDVRLDRESFDRIVTWIDMNAPYYGSYYSVYRDHVYGRAPLDDQQMMRLAELTGLPYQVPAAHV